MKYAVISSGGKQYKVSEGDELPVDKLNVTKDTSFTFPQVLLVRDGENITIGTPYVDKAVVSAKVLSEVKGKKITISKFKAKVHYRRKIGFRPVFTKVKIESISLNGKKEHVSKKPAPKKKSAVKA